MVEHEIIPVPRRVEPIIGKRQFRYPSEMTIGAQLASRMASSFSGKRTSLKYTEGAGSEPFYLTAKVERLDDGSVRLYDIRPSPTLGQADIEFVQSDSD